MATKNAHLIKDKVIFWELAHQSTPLSSTWPHLNSDVGLEEGEY